MGNKDYQSKVQFKQLPLFDKEVVKELMMMTNRSHQSTFRCSWLMENEDMTRAKSRKIKMTRVESRKIQTTRVESRKMKT